MLDYAAFVKHKGSKEPRKYIFKAGGVIEALEKMCDLAKVSSTEDLAGYLLHQILVEDDSGKKYGYRIVAEKTEQTETVPVKLLPAKIPDKVMADDTEEKMYEGYSLTEA